MTNCLVIHTYVILTALRKIYIKMHSILVSALPVCQVIFKFLLFVVYQVIYKSVCRLTENIYSTECGIFKKSTALVTGFKTLSTALVVGLIKLSTELVAGSLSWLGGMDIDKYF